MSRKQSYTFKVAEEAWEIEQIHRLNYSTFVEEIPQHQRNIERRLVDKFHHENTYLICVQNRQILGMMAVRDKRPFSLDQKLSDLDSYLPLHHRVCEVRLLATDQKQRNPRILVGIMRLLEQYVTEKGYDLLLISGTVHQRQLYLAMGFEPFGPVVGSGDAQFQPMYISLQNYESRFRDRWRSSLINSLRTSSTTAESSGHHTDAS